MSAIGSYSVLRRSGLEACLARAAEIRKETTGGWFSKKTRVVGTEAFEAAWRDALVRTVDFDWSGYVIGNYLDAQSLINGDHRVDDPSAADTALANAFTAGFLFDQPFTFPELDPDRLSAFCREEYGDDADGMVEAIVAAHDFYRRGLAEITPEQVVVFVIQ